MNNPINSKSNRIVSLDMIRLIAMLAVIMVHTASPILTESSPSSPSFFYANIFNSIFRIGVPFFLMISGALILNENKEFGFSKMLHQICRTLILLYIWSFIYALYAYIILPICTKEPISLTKFIQGFIIGHYHLWYLFAICGIYLVTPILKSFVKKQNLKLIKWIIFLSLFSHFFIPICNMLFNYYFNFLGNDIVLKYSKLFHINLFNEYVTYFLLGWFLLNTKLSTKYRSILYSLGGLSLLFTIIGMQYWSPKIDNVYAILYNNGSINILLYSVALFLLLHHAFQNIQSQQWIDNLSQISFGVYLIHPFYLSILYRTITFQNTIGLITLQWLLACIASVLTCILISKSPIFKKLITF